MSNCDQILGAGHTWKMVQILFMLFLTFSATQYHVTQDNTMKSSYHDDIFVFPQGEQSFDKINKVLD